MEDQTQGERITSWRILVNSVETLSGTSVGHKIIQRLPNATTLNGPATLSFEVLGSRPSVASPPLMGATVERAEYDYAERHGTGCRIHKMRCCVCILA